MLLPVENQSGFKKLTLPSQYFGKRFNGMWLHGFAISSNVEDIFRVYFRSFLPADNDIKNSIVNWIL